jgi:hypothetical protein
MIQEDAEIEEHRLFKERMERYSALEEDAVPSASPVSISSPA